MMLWKSKLDQEKELALQKADAISLNIVVIVLLASIAVQVLMDTPFSQWLVEFIVLMGLCIYRLVLYVKHGIYHRFSEPGRKSHLKISLLAGSCFGIFACMASFLYAPVWSIPLDVLVAFSVGFVITLLECRVFYYFTKQRSK